MLVRKKMCDQRTNISHNGTRDRRLINDQRNLAGGKDDEHRYSRIDGSNSRAGYPR